MSEVYENTDSRTASAEEESAINQELGGGNYKLIDRYDISQSGSIGGIQSWFFSADDILIKIINAKGTDGAKLVVQNWFGGSSYRIVNIQNNFLSDTTAKSITFLFERITEVDYKCVFNNNLQLTVIPNSGGFNYERKTTRLTIGTNNDNETINEGIIEIYGRSRF